MHTVHSDKGHDSDRGKKTSTLKIKDALSFDILIVRCG
jgi:hypothetical protein